MTTQIVNATSLIAEIEACPKGHSGWRNFEIICVKILNYLFVPPLQPPREQARTFSGIDRRDAVMPNRNVTREPGNAIWHQLYIDQDIRARIILFEFENYENGVNKQEVDQTCNYLTRPMGKLAFIFSREPPSREAEVRAHHFYNEHQKIIVFISEEEIKEMLRIKDSGGDPSEFLMTCIENFFIRHE